MKAFVSILDYGDKEALAKLVAILAPMTSIPVSLNQPGSALLVCEPAELGALFIALAENTETDWIEYTVQFG